MDKIFTDVGVRSIASAIPKNVLDLKTLGSVFGDETVEKIIASTGISEVRIADPDKTTADYCVAAAEELFAVDSVKPEDIDGIVFVTETPDRPIPHTSAIMQARLGLPNRTIAFDINYGCAGFVYGLFQASMMISSGYCQMILLCVGDTVTRHIDRQDRALRMVFGDAGAAVILTAVEGARPSVFNFHTEGDKFDRLTMSTGGYISMDGIDVMNFVVRNVRRVIVDAIKMSGLETDAIDLFALHQANALIVDHLRQRLKVPQSKIPFGAGKFGNTVSASIPLMLSTLYSGVNPSLERVLVCGFGTGLSIAAGVIDLSATKILSPLEF